MAFMNNLFMTNLSFPFQDLAKFLFQKQFCLPHYIFGFEKQEE